MKGLVYEGFSVLMFSGLRVSAVPTYSLLPTYLLFTTYLLTLYYLNVQWIKSFCRTLKRFLKFAKGLGFRVWGLGFRV